MSLDIGLVLEASSNSQGSQLRQTATYLASIAEILSIDTNDVPAFLQSSER